MTDPARLIHCLRRDAAELEASDLSRASRAVGSAVNTLRWGAEEIERLQRELEQERARRIAAEAGRGGALEDNR